MNTPQTNRKLPTQSREFSDAKSTLLLLLERIDVERSVYPPPDRLTLTHVASLKHYLAMKLNDLIPE